MPFITQDKRDVIDPIIDKAWDEIARWYQVHDWPLEQAGNLAYIVYRIMLLATAWAGKRGWGTMTRVWSDVTLTAAYFKKYEIDTYEDNKLEQNGYVTLDCFDDEIPF